MKSKKLHITKDSVNLIKELSIYSWKLDKEGKAMEVPVKLFDDCLDGLRYSIFTGVKIKISLAMVGEKRHNGLSAFDASMDKGYSDSSFRGFE